MNIEVHNVYDPEKPTEVTIRGEVEYNLESTDSFLGFLLEIKPETVDDYVRTLYGRLQDALKGYSDDPSFDKEEKFDLPHIKDYPKLVKSILHFTNMHLGVTSDTSPEDKIMVTSMKYTKSFRRLGYHRVKALVELLGEEKGVHLYKEIVTMQVRAQKHNLNDEILAVEMKPNAVSNWTNSGLGDFTLAVLDDHRVIYRFDKCLVPEALKDFNDPEIAYLSSCYTGDSPEWNLGRKRYMRRTQTLHHAPFCDEFYWDQEFCPDAEQPSLEFTESLGKGTG